MDLRGNGGDTPSGTGPNVIHFADDIRRVIQALNLRGMLIGDTRVPETSFRCQSLIREAGFIYVAVLEHKDDCFFCARSLHETSTNDPRLCGPCSKLLQ